MSAARAGAEGGGRAGAGWCNRSTVGISLASLFSDVSHELATAVLPLVLQGLGAMPRALGWIEGSANGIATLAKLWGGVASDRVRRRKPLAAAGYLVTAMGIAAISVCTTWLQVLLCRVAAWFGRGSRSAPRDVLMIDAVEAKGRGRAFGMERGADALGAVLGPLLAVWLLALGTAPQQVVLWSLLPGLLAFLAIVLLVVERTRRVAERRSFLGDVRTTGRPFQRFLVAILAFGCGDFSRAMLILYCTQHATGTLFSLTASTFAIALYALHNAVSALFAFPLGVVVDRTSARPVLVCGYFFAALVTAGFALLPPEPLLLVALFTGSGIYIACQEVAEKAAAAELLPPEVRGTGMGLLAATNGIGDFVASVTVGELWTALPRQVGVGFAVAAALQFAGAAGLLWTLRRKA
jgi:MFS family permease